MKCVNITKTFHLIQTWFLQAIQKDIEIGDGLLKVSAFVLFKHLLFFKLWFRRVVEPRLMILTVMPLAVRAFEIIIKSFSRSGCNSGEPTSKPSLESWRPSSSGPCFVKLVMYNRYNNCYKPLKALHLIGCDIDLWKLWLIISWIKPICFCSFLCLFFSKKHFELDRCTSSDHYVWGYMIYKEPIECYLVCHIRTSRSNVKQLHVGHCNGAFCKVAWVTQSFNTAL